MSLAMLSNGIRPSKTKWDSSNCNKAPKLCLGSQRLPRHILTLCCFEPAVCLLITLSRLILTQLQRQRWQCLFKFFTGQLLEDVSTYYRRGMLVFPLPFAWFRKMYWVLIWERRVHTNNMLECGYWIFPNIRQCAQSFNISWLISLISPNVHHGLYCYRTKPLSPVLYIDTD